ncbi:MAG: dTDP-4-dehydrorhamnose reductase [Kofleriaceae bacterium]|nr:dTDP-4-dehydrorhamnose reductase [Kofleriaceae bacterium]
MKILLTGSGGQLGHELRHTLGLLGHVHAVSSADCDLSDEGAVRSLVRAVRPDVIVNPAAFTAVDAAETQRDKAFAVNARAPEVLGQEAHAMGALVVHYSTDYVFDGNSSTPYVETDAPAPLNVYGESKRAGEQGLLATGADSLILRISWLVGSHGNNFAKTMLRLGKDRDTLQVVADQIGAPTSASMVAQATAHIVRARPREPNQLGLFHLTGGGHTSWFEYARFVFAHAARRGAPLAISPDRVEPIASSAYPTPAARPRNSRLDCTRFSRAFGMSPPDWTEGVNFVLDQLCP